MSTKKIEVPEFKGHTLEMYNLLKSGKGLTHNAVMAFKKAKQLTSAYAILFRLRRLGLKTKAFTIVAVGDTKPTRTYKLVKGVAKGTEPYWPKALPVRSAKPKSTKTTKSAKSAAKKAVAKKVAAHKAKKVAAHHSTPVKVAAKVVAKKAHKPVTKKETVLVGADDDDLVAE